MLKDELKVAFVQGRPHAHPTHIKYANALKADFYYVDYKISYHALPHAGSFRRYASWILSALTFPKGKYDVIFSEEAYFMVGLMRWFGLLNRKQKIIALMATHTLYFLNQNRYAPSTKKASIHLLKSYDGFICGSLLQKQLLLNLIGKDSTIPIYTIFNGVAPDRFQKLISLTPALTNQHMVFIGDVPNQGRVWYKGLDLMLEAFCQVKAMLPELTFAVIGDFDPILREELLAKHCPAYQSSVSFVGKVDNIENYLVHASLYFHISRGEAWGISVTEAMAAGVVPLVSDSTGAREAVSQVNENLITSSDIKNITEKIIWYFKLPQIEKNALSQKCKEVITVSYKEENAILNFKSQFKCLMSDLGIDKDIAHN